MWKRTAHVPFLIVPFMIFGMHSLRWTVVNTRIHQRSGFSFSCAYISLSRLSTGNQRERVNQYSGPKITNRAIFVRYWVQPFLKEFTHQTQTLQSPGLKWTRLQWRIEALKKSVSFKKKWRLCTWMKETLFVHKN